MLVRQRLKLMSRNQFSHLRENCIMMGHGLNLFVVKGFADTSIVTTCWDLSLSIASLWDSSGAIWKK